MLQLINDEMTIALILTLNRSEYCRRTQILVAIKEIVAEPTNVMVSFPPEGWCVRNQVNILTTSRVCILSHGCLRQTYYEDCLSRHRSFQERIRLSLTAETFGFTCNKQRSRMENTAPVWSASSYELWTLQWMKEIPTVHGYWYWCAEWLLWGSGGIGYWLLFQLDRDVQYFFFAILPTSFFTNIYSSTPFFCPIPILR